MKGEQMPTRALDLDIKDIKKWLSAFTIPVVIFAFSAWRRAEECGAMKELLEQLGQKPEYRDDVLFCLVNLDDGYGDILRPIGINDTPHIKIFLRGEEKGSSTCAGTGRGIIDRLNILLDPSRRHLARRAFVIVTAGGESPFTP